LILLFIPTLVGPDQAFTFPNLCTLCRLYGHYNDIR